MSVDFGKVQKGREKVIAKSAGGVAYLMKQNKIDVHTGAGRIIDAHTVEIGETRLSTRNIIIATGSVPRQIPNLRIDGEHVVDNGGQHGMAEVAASKWAAVCVRMGMSGS